MFRDIRSAVVLQIDKDGEYTLRAWDDAGEVLVLWVDERCPGDRLYEWTSREPDMSTLKELIGDEKIGHNGDGKVSPEMEQAIRAMLWKIDGGKLEPV